MRLEDRVLVVGQTGKGKSTLALTLLQWLQPVRTIVFDSKGEFEFPEYGPPARTPAQLAQIMSRPLVHYVPASFDRTAREEAWQIVWNTRGPYVVLVDEAAEETNANYCPEGLRLAVTQGRRLRKCVIANTQRLAECHPVFRSQAEHIIVFVPPPIELDLAEISRTTQLPARELERELRELHAEHGDFSHLWLCKPTSELRRCAPLPPAAGPGQPVRAADGRGKPRQAATTPAAEGSSSPPCDSSDTASGSSSRSG